MIYITGDTHGDFSIIESFCFHNKTTLSDVLIILGDVGINYFCDPYDRKLKEKLSNLPITLFCVHGNHEKRPESIASYKEVEYFGGVVYMEPTFPNLLFAKDGEIFEFNGKSCVVVGGAYSIDKAIRILNGWGWWDDEQPSEEIKKRVVERLGAENWSVDIVLSHTCPFKYMPTEAFLPGIDQNYVCNETEEWLDTIEEKLNYSRWYCGHFHIEKEIHKMRFLYRSIIVT